MKKKEALSYIRLHKRFVPYIGMFEIYNDEDEIPQELIDLSIREDKPRGNFIKRAVKPIHRFLAWIGCKAQR